MNKILLGFSIIENGIIHAAIEMPFLESKVLGAIKAQKIQVSISAVAFLRGIVAGDDVAVNWNGNLPAGMDEDARVQARGKREGKMWRTRNGRAGYPRCINERSLSRLIVPSNEVESTLLVVGSNGKQEVRGGGNPRHRATLQVLLFFDFVSRFYISNVSTCK